jgi:hypothetical protein
MQETLAEIQRGDRHAPEKEKRPAEISGALSA